MSPDRGFPAPPRSVKSEESIKRTMGNDHSFQRPSVESVSPLGNPRNSGRSWTSQTSSQSYRTHQIDPTNEDQLERNTALSVKSYSSGSHSRRDSAISYSSKERRRRPKTARTPSKGSLKPGRDTSLSELGSSPGRERLRRCATSPSAHLHQTNIEEALALHERSRQILATATVPSPYQSITSIAPKAPSIYRSQTTVDCTYGRRQDQFSRSYTSTSIAPLPVQQEATPYVPVPTTTTYWTTTESRRQEYAKIDKANKGFRGVWKKMIPRFARATNDSKFFDEKDDSDVCSVRRYRLDLDEEK